MTNPLLPIIQRNLKLAQDYERRQREKTAKAQEQICKDLGGPDLQITYPERRPAETDTRQDKR